MSWIKNVESFAAKAEKELESWWQKAPTLESIAETTITFVGPILQTVVTLEAGAAAGALVGKVLATAQSDLVAIKGLVTAVGATPTVSSILAGVQANLQALLAAAKVTNPVSVSKIQLVISELEALVTAFGTVAV